MQSLVTYKVICTYSKEPVRVPPKCCVTLSAFYNNTIVPCPACSCACGDYGKKSVLCLAGCKCSSCTQTFYADLTPIPLHLATSTCQAYGTVRACIDASSSVFGR